MRDPDALEEDDDHPRQNSQREVATGIQDGQEPVDRQLGEFRAEEGGHNAACEYQRDRLAFEIVGRGVGRCEAIVLRKGVAGAEKDAGDAEQLETRDFQRRQAK